MRADQLSTFVIIATGQAAVWMPGPTSVYHATVDGLRAVCNRSILVAEDARLVEDRSACTMTCENCARRVRRLPGEREPVDVDAAKRRHAAWRLGVPVQDLGPRYR